jgi:uncharacterized membrane protein YcaP (DUF421 family)
MDANRPILNPGDQKVIGQAIVDPSHETHVTPSSRTANRIWMVLMLLLAAVGLWCAVAEELFSGIIMITVGVVVTAILVKIEISDRMMVRRMRRRGEQSSHARNVA